MSKIIQQILFKINRKIFKFSVIIPTLQKDINILNILVKSLIKDDFVDEILVIDNSLKGKLNFNSSKVKILKVDKNLFVNQAWNYGIENMKNEYFALLNDDLLLPEKFFVQIYEFIKKTPDCGLIGLESSTVINKKDKNFETYPKTTPLLFKPINNIDENRDYFWGSAIFGKKENYYKIPSDIMIWSGDRYLMLKNKLDNKKCYAIYNTKIKHYGSLSSNNPKFDAIKKKDKENYLKYESVLSKVQNEC